MKMIFLYPEYYEIARFGKTRKEYPPFGIMYLAAVAEQMGEIVKIQSVANNNYRFDLSEYDVVLYSLPSSCTYSLMLKSRQTSIFAEKALLVTGGIHASLFPKEVFVELDVDYLIKGEGEIALTEIVKCYKQGKVCADTKGVLCRENFKNEVEFADYVADLDALPLPARHLLPEEDFIMTGRLSIRDLKMTHILVSRGCPYNCYFCGGINKNHRYRGAESVYNELVMLKERYDIAGFVINDENFTINKAKVLDICRAIQKIQLPWSALSRVDTIDEEMVMELAKAGCIELKFGLESGSNTMLREMNKRCTAEQAYDALKLCEKYGIKAKLFLIHGFPGESATTTDETIAFLTENEHLIDRISLFKWTPLPGSYVYRHAERYQINLEKLSYDNAIIYGKEKNWFADDAYNKLIAREYARLLDVVERINGRSHV